VGDLVGWVQRFTGTGLLCFSTFNALWEISSSVKGEDKVISYLRSDSRPWINRAMVKDGSSTNSQL